jgi:hypothetical protein
MADLVILMFSSILFYSFVAACDRNTAFFLTSFFLSASRAFLSLSSLSSRSFAINAAISATMGSRFAGSHFSVVSR